MISENYKELIDILNDFVQRRNAAVTNEYVFSAKMQQEIDQLDEKCAEVLQEIEKNKRMTLSLQQQVFDYNYTIRETYAPLQFDKVKLSALSMSVNSDYDAQKLYDMSAGMLSWLNEKQNQLLLIKTRESTAIKEKYKQMRANETEFNLTESINQLMAPGSAYAKIIKLLENDKKKFGGSDRQKNLENNTISDISIGIGHISIPAVPAIASQSNYAIDFKNGVAIAPVRINWDESSVILVGFTLKTEMQVLSGVTNLVINSAIYGMQNYDEIVYFDTVRYNGHGIKPLTKLCGSESTIISSVPAGKIEVYKRFEKILENCKAVSDRGENVPKRILIIHNYPNGYSQDTISIIKRLCANSKLYNLNILLTYQQDNDSEMDKSIIEFQNESSATITAKGTALINNEKFAGLIWYPAPEVLSEFMLAAFKAPPKKRDTNSYDTLAGISSTPAYQKGTKHIEPIPYGKDEAGNVQYLDIEDTNFATFICGASRSGKSTLLHTIITGIIKSTHPDDIEMWLIDFKMTEFSRYIKHLPPHVRYIVLDESPELVYDLVDRLYEILMKRQSIFKANSWEKMNDIPPNRYMPAMLVIIDEFSVMSEILAQSLLRASDNYQYKMQLLLVKGAAVGMHFIFASQGFSNGTRGLTEMAKNQIAQRVAMKTPISEIRQTLDIRNPSERDIQLMEELSPHHALVRVPISETGNRLLLSKVLYIDDVEKQYQMIDNMYKIMEHSKTFEPDNNARFISKKPLILDGNTYRTFEEQKSEFKRWFRQNEQKIEDTEEIAFFIGQALRLLPDAPIFFSKAFRENMLLIAPMAENDAAASVITSIAKSMQLNSSVTDVRDIIILSSPKSKLIGRLREIPSTEMYIGLDSVCEQIRKIKYAIESKKDSNCVIVLLGFESLLQDMAFAKEEAPIIRRKPEGQLDVITKLRLVREGKLPESVLYEESSEEDNNEESKIYDARKDLNFILINGPRLGYHCVLYFFAAGDIEQSKIDDQLFKHKICFRASRRELSPLLGALSAEKISELPDRIFYYTDGVTSTSYRPFLHSNVSWDGWCTDEYGHATVKDNSDEYLL